jgi:hypothetical protein
MVQISGRSMEENRHLLIFGSLCLSKSKTLSLAKNGREEGGKGKEGGSWEETFS